MLFFTYQSHFNVLFSNITRHQILFKNLHLTIMDQKIIKHIFKKIHDRVVGDSMNYNLNMLNML